MQILLAYSLVSILTQWISLPGALAQTTNATCVDDSLSWMSNSKGQSPCLVAAYLLNGCSSATWNVPPLNITLAQFYQGPSAQTASLCQCSSVVFDLLSACGQCQGQLASDQQNWAKWDANCGGQWSMPQGVWKLAIPSGTSIPSWAYITPDQMNGTFDATIARSLGTGPESTATASATGSAPTQTGASNAPPPSSKSHVGAIVGGVLGGLAGIFILIVLGLFLKKRRREQKKKQEDAEKPVAGATAASPPQSFDEAYV